jgi:hypothetical protein
VEPETVANNQNQGRKSVSNRIAIQPGSGEPGAPNFVRVEKLPEGTASVTFSILNSVADRVFGPVNVSTRGRRAQADIPFANPSQPGAYLGVIGTADGRGVMVTKAFGVGMEDNVEPAEDGDSPFAGFGAAQQGEGPGEGESGTGDDAEDAQAASAGAGGGQDAEDGGDGMEGTQRTLAASAAHSGGPGRRRRA